MRIGWGNRILVLYLGFVGLILTLVVLSHQQDINLVQADYYEQEKLYDKKYKGMENLRNLGKEVRVSFAENNVEVVLPTPAENGKITGSLHFFRPSSAGLDIADSFSLSQENSLKYDFHKFQKGKYLLWVTWEQGDKNYYSEQAVFIP